MNLFLKRETSTKHWKMPLLLDMAILLLIKYLSLVSRRIQSYLPYTPLILPSTIHLKMFLAIFLRTKSLKYTVLAHINT